MDNLLVSIEYYKYFYSRYFISECFITSEGFCVGTEDQLEWNKCLAQNLPVFLLKIKDYLDAPMGVVGTFLRSLLRTCSIFDSSISL